MNDPYIPNGYTFTQELIDAENLGYSNSATTHRSPTVGGSDNNGVETGYSLGYKASASFHRDTNSFSLTDQSGNASGYKEGYLAAAADHTNQVYDFKDRSNNLAGYTIGYHAARVDHRSLNHTGNDAGGVQTGFARGYQTARDEHLIADASNQDAFGSLTGFATGYRAARDFHTSPIFSGSDLTGTNRGYTVGSAAGYSSGYSLGFNEGHLSGSAAELRPHFIVGLSGNHSIGSNDVITTLNCNTTHSIKGATRSGSTITVNEAGTWEFYLVFSWAIQGAHLSNTSSFTRGFIYEGSTIRGRGASRRRSGNDWFGSVAASWRGAVNIGDTFSARAEFDGASSSMTVFKDSTDIDSVGIPTYGGDRGSYSTEFGPACRFIGVKIN